MYIYVKLLSCNIQDLCRSLTVKLSTVVPRNSMALYVAPDTEISPIICEVQIVGLVNNATRKERKLQEQDSIQHKQKTTELTIQILKNV